MGVTINQGQLYEMVSKPYAYQKYAYAYTGGAAASSSSSSSSTGSQAPAPAAAAPAQQAPPASPTAAASDLQVMLASIRPVQDGQVITAEDHNALRLAMVAIANRLGIGMVSEEITVTVVPDLIAVADGSNAWLADLGVATKPTITSGAAKGWMEVELPDGARIKKIVAYGSIAGGSGEDGKLKVRLVRQKVTDSTKSLVLAVAAITSTTPATGADADVTLPEMGLGVNAIEEARIIDNRENKYLLTAEVANLTGVTSAKLACAQIVCGMK